MAILKSRFGKDGIIFEDIVFDNGTLVIDTEDTSDVSFLQFEKGEDQKRSNLVVDALNKRDARMAKKKQTGVNNLGVSVKSVNGNEISTPNF